MRRAKGTGYLIANPDGTKTLRKSVKDPLSGKERRIQVTAATETACIKLMKKRLAELDKETSFISSSERMTVADLCRRIVCV